jgi:hypothetical protein
MSDSMIKLIAAGVLLLHGLGHGGALGALAWIQLSPGSDTGAWLAARSWLVPSLSANTATTLAGVFWIVSMVGFVVAAMSMFGVVFPSSIWRPLAVASALVSIVGIVLFFGTWPMFNTVAALGVNAVVLVAVLWLRWPSEAMLGR